MRWDTEGVWGDTGAPAGGYIGGGTLRDSGGILGLQLAGIYEAMICRLNLSFLCVVSICQGGGEG